MKTIIKALFKFFKYIGLLFYGLMIIGLVLSLALRKTSLAAIDRRYPPVDEKETLGD